MASLIIAQKYCQQNRIPNIHFLSATSSALPFPDNYFDLVNSQAVLEHVDDQSKTLQEINRVLRPGGCFTGDSVNRYNLFTPEPHVELRLVSCLPKRLAHRISLWLKNLPYDDIKPLSYKELRLLLRQAFGDRFQIISLVETSEESFTHTVMKRLPAKLLDLFAPPHYIVALKNN
jgi:ubiquinone/menaquinone biosynthesis C-methylase UbiE